MFFEKLVATGPIGFSGFTVPSGHYAKVTLHSSSSSIGGAHVGMVVDAIVTAGVSASGIGAYLLFKL